MLSYYLTGLIIVLWITTTILLLNKYADHKVNSAFKIFAILMAVVFFFRFELGKENISSILFLTVEKGFTSKGQIIFSALLVWLLRAGEILLFIQPFFRNKFSNSLVATFGVFVYAINIIFFNNTALAIVGESAFTTVNLRTLLLIIELGMGFALSLSTLLLKSNDIKSLPKIQRKWFWLSIVGMVLAATPNYSLQLFLDTYNIAFIPTDLTIYHRFYIYPMVIIPIALYFLLYKHPINARRFVLIFYSIAQLLGFCHFLRFSDFANSGWVTCLPFHLCNTALFITPLCLIFNWKKLFYFTYFINVLGAFLAIVMPDIGESTFFETETFRFYTDHYQAFYMPLLIVGLGIFPRPKWKEFKYSLTVFTFYFVAMLIVNAWFTNYNPDVNYFFLNNDFIPDKFGTWAENLLNTTWQFYIGDLKFVFYPIYQFLFYIVYVGATFGMWFLYELAYDIISGWQDIASKNKKIKADAIALSVALNGRDIKEPINMEGINKLKLNNFTKRYATSDVYAVKDANLEVCAGEIFGFLGPNGAGKSTIIKSIVGIQSITEGSIEVCGYDVQSQSVMAKRQIGFVPDNYALYERLTAREYINYIADLYEVSQHDRNERLDRFIKLFEFETAIDNPIKTYSHGMKQKVTIMSALIHNPKLWILDEPLTGLDPNSIYQVKECMKQHASQGNIVFFSSHIIDVVERICTKIAIIKKGQIQCVRNIAEMEQNGENLEQFYMDIINNQEIEAIAVNKSEKGKKTSVGA